MTYLFLELEWSWLNFLVTWPKIFKPNDSTEKLSQMVLSQVTGNQNHLLFILKKCSISEFQFGRNKNTLERVCFIVEGRSLNHKSLVRDVGLMIDESLNWTEHVKVRVGKAAKSFFLLRRSTSPIICTQSKAHLYRTIITASLLFASECWELRKTSFKFI